ncbi:MAG: hypothetical protein ACRD01_03300 [Terriglobales bacterium]
MRAPEKFVAWMSANPGFNPRSQKSSDALTDYVVADLRAACPELDLDIKVGGLAMKKTADVQSGLATRNVDLVMSDAESGQLCVTVENKSLMTAHGKARKNRYGDLIAYCTHVHQNRPECIAGATIVINTSAAYENPDAFAKGMQRPSYNMAKVVPETVALFAGIPIREFPDQSWDRPETLCVILVNYDGRNPASLVAPLPNTEALGYDVFLKRIAELYQGRFT